MRANSTVRRVAHGTNCHIRPFWILQWHVLAALLTVQAESTTKECVPYSRPWNASAPLSPPPIRGAHCLLCSVPTPCSICRPSPYLDHCNPPKPTAHPTMPASIHNALLVHHCVPILPSSVRYQEYEADAIGARIMARAGFDPASDTLLHFVRSCSQVRRVAPAHTKRDIHTCSSTLRGTYRTGKTKFRRTTVRLVFKMASVQVYRTWDVFHAIIDGAWVPHDVSNTPPPWRLPHVRDACSPQLYARLKARLLAVF